MVGVYSLFSCLFFPLTTIGLIVTSCYRIKLVKIKGFVMSQ